MLARKEMKAIAAALGTSVEDLFGDPPDFIPSRMAPEMEDLRLSPEAIAEIAEFVQWVREADKGTQLSP